MSDEYAALPAEAREFFESGGTHVRRLVSIVEKLEDGDALPTLIDAIDGLSRDDMQSALLVAVLGIVGSRRDRAKEPTP